MEGNLNGESFSIAGNVSSQFISGLLMALPLLDHSVCLRITEGIESAPYVDLTLDVLSSFGISYTKEKSTYSICARSEFAFQKNFDIEGDWSNAAPFLCMGVMGKGAVSVNRLSPNSKQGDFAIIELIKAFGGCIVSTDNGFTAYPSKLFGSDVDATQTPDLVPVLAVLASVAEGKTRIYGASRLRLKESDRLTSICEMLSTLGADIAQTEDGLIINGRPTLRGGRVRSYNDHRIVMAAAVAAVACETPVTIENCEAVEKSYPSFFEHLELLGIKITND
jgi:3-phosphoshikimate 1-carboxyvinyltransferase